jgi:hypothetical protein
LPPEAPIKFVRADATTYQFKPAEFDLLFSRFGVMFFAEPSRAFANLRMALKPSGRLAFACWRKFDENPWLQVPLRAALEHVPPLPRPGPEDPGPFSFASEQRVRHILGNAGFQSVMLEPRDFVLDVACGGGIEQALDAAMALGPQAAPCRTKARKRMRRLPPRSGARCNPINAVSRLLLPGQSGLSPRTTRSVAVAAMDYDARARGMLFGGCFLSRRHSRFTSAI